MMTRAYGYSSEPLAQRRRYGRWYRRPQTATPRHERNVTIDSKRRTRHSRR